MTPENNSTSEKKSNLPLLILFLLSLAVNGYLLFNWYQENYAGGTSLKTQNEALKATLETTQYAQDSLQQQYEMVLQQHQDLLNEFEGIKSERDKALADADAKAVKIRQLLSRAKSDPKALMEAKNEIESLKNELNARQKELEEVRQSKDIFEQEAKANLSKAEQLKKEKTKSDQKTKELETKIKSAKFQIDELKVNTFRDKKGKMEITPKANKVDQIEVSFVVLGSDLIETGEKELVLRILGVNGEVLGANNNTLVDSDKLASMQKTINYQGTSQNVSFKFKQDEVYKQGGHTAEIWYNGERMVRTQFKLE